MPIPVRLLLSSPSRLIAAIVLFVVLDLSVLIINLWIANHVAEDAVAINLAGRQRMLSQQITKSLLLAHHAPDAVNRAQALQELSQAYELFRQTLIAFDRGGTTRGGDGQPTRLHRVMPGMDGRLPLDEAIQLIAPLARVMDAYQRSGELSDTTRAAIVAYMTRHNRDILARMNRLTTALEHSSVQRISRLRIIQTGAFLLALANFLIIVLGLVRQYHHVEKDGRRWRELAQRDPLTGLLNRTAFRAGIDNALQNYQEAQPALTILMLDLDGFKPINDRYGHAAGDQFLQQVGQTLASTARESDLVARLGGDEFALLCPHLHGANHIRQFCERLIQAIEHLPGPEGAHMVRASVGAAVYPDHGQDVDELLAAADRAMYRSKAAGGGRCGLAELNRSPVAAASC